MFPTVPVAVPRHIGKSAAFSQARRQALPRRFGPETGGGIRKKPLTNRGLRS
jgi:hypothetical protein